MKQLTSVACLTAFMMFAGANGADVWAQTKMRNLTTRTYRQNSETGNLSGHHRAERTAPAVKVSGTQFGSSQKALRDRLMDTKFLLPVPAMLDPNPLESEVRTLRLYHVHTGESLVVIYKRNGRYVPSAMAQLDYFLRDWRTNSFVSMSGETVDLLWELHNELGSKQPINVICGYRSAQTNALLKRIGRQVATRSEHLSGRAIDMCIAIRSKHSRPLTYASAEMNSQS
jgi:uncharacterized protein YcbK (DUF882 family)